MDLLGLQNMLNRRVFLKRSLAGLGAVSLGSLLNPLASPLHHVAKAKRVIFLFQAGGPSQMDLFDYKPLLNQRHQEEIPDTIRGKQRLSGMVASQGKFPIAGSPFAFRQYGKSGTWVSELFPHTAQVVDDLCFVKSMHTNAINHDPGITFLQTGSERTGRPCMGSWISYGLGTVNQNLPSFMVLAPAAPYAGAQTWASDFLPACHQGTHVVPGKNPLPNATPLTPNDSLQKLELALRKNLNQSHLENRATDKLLDARIRSFETAFGMQREAP